MNMTRELYADMTKYASPRSKGGINAAAAFLTGGTICAIGQVLLQLFKTAGFGETQAATWTSIVLIAVAAIFTGLGWYEKIARVAGAGTLVPITGFSNAVASCAIEAQSEGFVFGVGAKIFSICGPVILYGCSASVIYGLVYYFIR